MKVKRVSLKLEHRRGVRVICEATGGYERDLLAALWAANLAVSLVHAARVRAFARAQGRSPGGDIFLHGQPNSMPFGRVPGDWTDGCIALSNADMRKLWNQVRVPVPIEITP